MRNTLVLILLASICAPVTISAQSQPDHEDLLELFADWRAFEKPPLLDGAPDYTNERFALRQREFEALRARLDAFDISAWSIPEQVDWHLVRAEMNGYDFNYRVLKPWARDPAFYDTVWTYRSDVPAHEGPTHHAVVELWTYEFPLTDDEAARLVSELSVIPPLMNQAVLNLTGNARDLWVTGIRDMRSQDRKLAELAEKPGVAANDRLMDVIEEGRRATNELVAWLEAEAPSKTGPSGIGREKLHLVPAKRTSRATHLGGRSTTAEEGTGPRLVVAEAGGAT